MKIFSKKILIFLLCAGAFFIGGCIRARVYLQGISPSAKPFEQREYEIIGEAEGQSSSFYLFWAIPVTPGASYGEALEKAINEQGGDNLIEAVYTCETQHSIVGTVKIFKVKGTAVRYK